jgi:tRNA (cytidine56-2'-O)-methyltransferase
MTEIYILRLGHRPERDKRVTTHVALTARAFGAKGIYVSTKDEELERSVRSVAKRFGGDFTITTGIKWKEFLRNFEGTKVHLTMYGTHIDDALPRVRTAMTEKNADRGRRGEGAPRSIPGGHLQHRVGNQPHSEVAALSVFLDRLKEGVRAAHRLSCPHDRDLSRASGGRRLSTIPNEQQCLDILRAQGAPDRVIKLRLHRHPAGGGHRQAERGERRSGPSRRNAPRCRQVQDPRYPARRGGEASPARWHAGAPGADHS